MSDRDRLMAVAAHAVRALRPDLVDGFARAFRRDITITNYRLAPVFDILGIPHRRTVRADALPGRVTCISDGDRERPSATALAELFARGGTFVCEGNSGLAHAGTCGLEVTPVMLRPGRVEVTGPAVDWLPTPAFAWFDRDLSAIVAAPEHVLVRNASSSVVARLPVDRGWFVHIGWITAPFKREAPAGPETTHRAFAESLGIEPRDVLATDTPIDAIQAAAATLMVGVLADIVSRAAA